MEIPGLDGQSFEIKFNIPHFDKNDIMTSIQPLKLIYRIFGFSKEVHLEIKGEPQAFDEGFTYPVQAKELIYRWIGIKIKTIML